MQVHYLEIVTPDVEVVCEQYSKAYGSTFSEPDASLGGARTSELDGGWKVGVRAPMHEAERSVVRPYFLVSEIVESVKAAETAGATVAVPPMEIPGHGSCAIVMKGDIETGFWQK